MTLQIAKRLFTVDEYHRMARAGVFKEDDHCELIEGEIVEKSPIGSLHVTCVNRLNFLFNQHAGQEFFVSVQNPIRLNDSSEPEPDLALLKWRDDFYAEGLSKPNDVWLVVEVADSSIEYDRDVKTPLYARAGIPEVWVVELMDAMIEIYTRPANGKYRSVERVLRGDTLSPKFASHVLLRVDDILGQARS